MCWSCSDGGEGYQCVGAAVMVEKATSVVEAARNIVMRLMYGDDVEEDVW